MKKSILTILYIARFFILRGQETSIKDEIKLTLPYGTKKLTASEFATLSYLKFPEPVISDHFCSKDGLVINFRTTMDNVFKRSLEQNERIFTSQGCNMPRPIILYSKIITVNDIKVLIIKQKKNDIYITSFRSDYNNLNQFIYGLIQNKELDHDKAKQYLEELLCSLHF